MEENQFKNAPRKIRKIKRPRAPENQPATYGVPEKISVQQNSLQNETAENYYDNNGDAENIHFITDEELMPQEPETVTYFLKNKTVLLMLVLAALFGVVLGSTLFSTQETAKKGLDGVVVNSDVPVGRSRCGLVEPHQGCVLYIMNPRNQEVTGKDFFATAAQWTRRERYLIETGNMHYSSKRIRPGYIAQINIPPLSNNN
ncbi:MAG: hypothetical protein MR350_02535 [Alphaproteobacteria bacterium]|nr:hypothetical protein [Alphaproteobacteria bacterium]